MIKKAVIPAAGWGTRFLPITKAVAKEMLPIIDKPALAYIVEEAKESGIEEIIMIISNDKDSIKTYFGENKELTSFLKEKGKNEDIELISNTNYGIKISYVLQNEQLGLGHAILQAEELVGNEPFAILLGDDVYHSDKKPALKQIIDAYSEKKSSILGTMEVSDEDTKKYGICIPKVGSSKPIVELTGVIEKPQSNPPSNSAISGRYVLTPKIFDLLKTQTKGAGGEIQLTDSILKLMEYESVYSMDIIGKRYDIGSKIGYIESIIEYSLRRDDLKVEVKELLKSIK